MHVTSLNSTTIIELLLKELLQNLKIFRELTKLSHFLAILELIVGKRVEKWRKSVEEGEENFEQNLEKVYFCLIHGRAAVKTEKSQLAV